MISEPAALDSIIRQRDQITYMVAPTAEKHYLTRFDASCSEPTGSMFFMTQSGMRALSDDPPSSMLPQLQLQVLQSSEQLRKACAYRAEPDWRALDTADGQDWLVLARNSPVLENGLLKVWTGRQLAIYQVTSNNTLVARIHERLAIDCRQRSYKRLSQFNEDANGRVYTGQIDQNERVPVFPLESSEQRRIIDAACQPDVAVKLPVPPARTPSMPKLQTPTTDTAVLSAINALQLPQPRLTLQSLRYRYDTLVFNGMKITDVQRADVFNRDEQSGQLLLQQSDPAVGIKLRLTFRGLFDLASRSFDRESGKQVGDKLDITGVNFEGDWRRMPERGEVAYSLIQTKAGKPHTTVVTCKIGTALPASQIHASSQGIAKPLTCTKLKTARMAWTVSFNYLEDYGVFALVEEKSPVGHWVWHVESAQ